MLKTLESEAVMVDGALEGMSRKALGSERARRCRPDSDDGEGEGGEDGRRRTTQRAGKFSETGSVEAIPTTNTCPSRFSSPFFPPSLVLFTSYHDIYKLSSSIMGRIHADSEQRAQNLLPCRGQEAGKTRTRTRVDLA